MSKTKYKLSYPERESQDIAVLVAIQMGGVSWVYNDYGQGMRYGTSHIQFYLGGKDVTARVQSLNRRGFIGIETYFAPRGVTRMLVVYEHAFDELERRRKRSAGGNPHGRR